MGVVAWIIGLILIAMFLVAGGVKVVGTKMAVETAEKLDYSSLRVPIGVAELLGVLGLLIGLLTDGNTLELIGLFAAIGLILAMIGAVVYHIRGGDGPKEYAPAVVMAVLCVLYIVAIGAR